MKQKTKRASKGKARNGSALLLATILLFVVLSMVASLSYVTVMEQKMSQKTKSSVGAFYNSESGVEWALNQIANSSGPKISNVFPAFSGSRIDCPSSFGGANTCQIYLLDADGKIITDQNSDISLVKAVRSVGTQGNETVRAIEAAVAAGVSYTYYCFTKPDFGTPLCTDSGGSQGYCPSGYIQKLALGSWGFCGYFGYGGGTAGENFWLPPGGACTVDAIRSVLVGNAYVCS